MVQSKERTPGNFVAPLSQKIITISGERGLQFLRMGFI